MEHEGNKADKSGYYRETPGHIERPGKKPTNQGHAEQTQSLPTHGFRNLPSRGLSHPRLLFCLTITGYQKGLMRGIQDMRRIWAIMFEKPSI